MRKLAYILYVAVVLLISGLTRANAEVPTEVQVKIGQVISNSSNLNMKVQGFLPNGCYVDPSLSLNVDRQNPTVLVLSVHSTIVPQHVCAHYEPPYSLDLNLAELAQSSHIPVDPKTIYLVKADGSNLEMQISGSELIQRLN